MSLNFDPRKKSAERRTAKREHCRLSVSMRERGRSVDLADVIEISEAGCAIDGSPILGGFHVPVFLSFSGISSFRARFVWTNGQRTGLEFDTPIHEAVLERVLRHEEAPETFVASKDAVADGVSSSRREQIKLGYAEQPLLKRKKRLGDRELSSLIARKTERSTEHRRETRYPIEYATAPDTIEVDGEELDLRDISSSGLGISLVLDREIGAPLMLTFADCDPIEGRVIWRNGERTGIALQPGAISLNDDSADETEAQAY
ncbi:MAG: PilZ domain-containing protein [Pseudomonadota bacterium]